MHPISQAPKLELFPHPLGWGELELRMSAKAKCPLSSKVEVDSLIEMLPNVVLSIREDKYEHLDTMWADTAKDTVFPKVETLVRQMCPTTGNGGPTIW
ncbi:unnamed protein product [Ectocarpus fasciculatus]